MRYARRSLPNLPGSMTPASVLCLLRAIKRIGRARFVRNVAIAIGNSGDPNLAAEAERLLDDESPLVRGAAIWALGRLGIDRLRQCAKNRRGSEADPAVSAEWAAALAPAESRH